MGRTPARSASWLTRGGTRDPEEDRLGVILDRARRCRASDRVTQTIVFVDGCVCRVACQRRSMLRRTPPPTPYRDKLVARMREMTVANPPGGRRCIKEFPPKERWSVGARLVKRLRRHEAY